MIMSGRGWGKTRTGAEWIRERVQAGYRRIGLIAKTPADARDTVEKVKRVRKPLARKIQILTVGEQRAKVMGKSQVASIFRKGKDAIRKTHNRKGKKV